MNTMYGRQLRRRKLDSRLGKQSYKNQFALPRNGSHGKFTVARSKLYYYNSRQFETRFARQLNNENK